MTLPAAWNTVRVYGRFLDFRTSAPARGMLQFTPTRRVSVADTGSRTIVMPTPRGVALDALGEFSIQLPVTDDPDLDQSGWHWMCVESIGGATRTYYFDLLLSGGDLDIATAVPLQPADHLLPGPPGPAGHAADIAADTHAALSKATPDDADELPLADSAGGWSLKKLTWANLKAAFGSFVTSVAGRTGAVALTTADVSGALAASNNLSDVASAATARSNLGLGSAATTAASDYATAAQGAKADDALLRSVGGAVSGALSLSTKLVITPADYSNVPLLDVGSNLGPPADPTVVVKGPNNYSLLGVFGGGGAFLAGSPYAAIGTPDSGRGELRGSFGYDGIGVVTVIGATDTNSVPDNDQIGLLIWKNRSEAKPHIRAQDAARNTNFEVAANGAVFAGATAKSSLPSASAYTGFIRVVTDASTGYTVVVSNGTNWIDLQTGTTVA